MYFKQHKKCESLPDVTSNIDQTKLISQENASIEKTYLKPKIVNSLSSSKQVLNHIKSFSKSFSRINFIPKYIPIINNPIVLEGISQIISENSTSGLIMNDRPISVPPKTPQELEHHMKLSFEFYDSIRRDKEEKIKQHINDITSKHRREEELSTFIDLWKNQVIPNWENEYYQYRVQQVWWKGVPPCVRADVWKRSVGNNLNFTNTFICISLSDAELSLKHYDECKDNSTENRMKELIQVIDLDVIRTFPQLKLFQTGGPLYQHVRTLLLAYACFRKDIGYVQGMSFVVAILLLNMDITDAFIVFSNMMNTTMRLSLFTLGEDIMNTLFHQFSLLLQHRIPKLHQHFTNIDLSPDIFLLDWLLTVFTRLLPLDTSSRMLDVFFRDGEIFLFRAAIGYLKFYQQDLYNLDGFGAAVFLTTKKSDINNETLFDVIYSVKPPEEWYMRLRNSFRSLLDI